tara:strand:+ start:6623 stop:7780 length:1158 start_codon:yes stop_codon:yes gene_type:complete
MYKIPLSSPKLSGNEWDYVKDCIDSEWVSSAGKYVELFETCIADFVGSRYAVACVNGTSALQISLRIAGVLPGHEVIAPSLTFIAPINAVSYNGAIPVFMDADLYYNMDIEKTIHFIKKETVFKNGSTYNKASGRKISAIIPVHVWGNAICFDDLSILCRERNINVIEDASESLGSFYNSGSFKGRHTGTVGNLGCISFNGNKIITSGGGGMIITDNETLANKARYLTTQAKDNSTYYVHNEIGFNFRITNIQAALGLAQLEQLPQFLKRKKEIHHYYKSCLELITGIDLAAVPSYADNNHWMNVIRIDKKTHPKSKVQLLEYLIQKGIEVRPVWKQNHLQKPYINNQGYKIEMVNHLVKNSLCIPSSVGLSNEDIDSIIKELNE